MAEEYADDDVIISFGSAPPPEPKWSRMRSPSPSFSPVEHPSWSYDEDIIVIPDEDDEDIPGASSSGPTLKNMYEELSKKLCPTLETTLETTLKSSFETSRAPVLF